jgi:hypothetical protein
LTPGWFFTRFSVAMLWVSFQSMAFAPVMRSSSALHCSFSVQRRWSRRTASAVQCARVVQPGDVVQRFQRSEIMLQGWVLKISQRPGDHRS